MWNSNSPGILVQQAMGRALYVDGIGGCLKWSATEKVKTQQCIVNDAKDFVQAVQGSKIDVTFISAQDVIARERSLGLTEIFVNAIPI